MEYAPPDQALLGQYYDLWYRKVRERAASVGYSAGDRYNEIVKRNILEQEIASALSLRERPLWLDYGCGPAYLWQDFPLPAGCRCIGLDVSARVIQETRRKFKGRSELEFHLVQDGLLDRMESCQVDVISMIEVLEHVYDAEVLLKKLYRVLRPGGLLLITTPNRLRAATALRAVLPSAWSLFLEDRDAHRSIDELEEEDIELKSFGVKTHFRELSPGELTALLDRSGFVMQTLYRTALKIMPNRTFNAIAGRWAAFPDVMAALDAGTRRWPISFFKMGMVAVASKPPKR